MHALQTHSTFLMNFISRADIRNTQPTVYDYKIYSDFLRKYLSKLALIHAIETEMFVRLITVVREENSLVSVVVN